MEDTTIIIIEGTDISMRMFNRLPQCVYFNNKRYDINTDYRLFIDFEIKMQGKDKKKAINNCLFAFFPAFLDICNQGLYEEAVEKFIWFYRCGREEIESRVKRTGANNAKAKQLFSYEYDDELIYGAFKEQYNINLDRVYLHWWEFKALLKTLSSECEFCKAKGYRGYDGKDKDLLKLKDSYKLPLTQAELDEEERHKKIYEELRKPL